VLALDEVVRDPQLVRRGLFAEIEHPKLGPVRQVAFPAQMSETPARLRTPAPEHGEHTDELLPGLGYDAPTLAALRLGRAGAGAMGPKSARSGSGWAPR